MSAQPSSWPSGTGRVNFLLQFHFMSSSQSCDRLAPPRSRFSLSKEAGVLGSVVGGGGASPGIATLGQCGEAAGTPGSMLSGILGLLLFISTKL